MARLAQDLKVASLVAPAEPERDDVIDLPSGARSQLPTAPLAMPLGFKKQVEPLSRRKLAPASSLIHALAPACPLLTPAAPGAPNAGV